MSDYLRFAEGKQARGSERLYPGSGDQKTIEGKQGLHPGHLCPKVFIIATALHWPRETEA